jgi:shikimate kinase
VHISIIGMSNVGKTAWSKRLVAESGFELICCDAMIEQMLGIELTKLGYAGIEDVAKWMGQPYEPHYPETSARYVHCEREVMLAVIEKLKTTTDHPLVIDTTGSVITVGDDIIEQLRNLTNVMYFEASPEQEATLFERYIANPKPVIWENLFSFKPGETEFDALKRCYPDLLHSRAQRYKKMAHVTLSCDTLKESNGNINMLLDKAKK